MVGEQPPEQSGALGRIAASGDWQVGVAYARRRRYKDLGDLLTVVAYVFRRGEQSATLSTTDFVVQDAQHGIRYAAMAESEPQIVDKFRDLMNVQDKNKRWQSLYLRLPGGAAEGPAPAVESGRVQPGIRFITALWFMVPPGGKDLMLHFAPGDVAVRIRESDFAA